MDSKGSLLVYPETLTIARTPRNALAIVGAHPNGRVGVPWDDESVDICLFNEQAMKPEKYPRWSMLLQIHKPEVYQSLSNWVNKDHWAWLQQDHGKPIWMQDVDPLVPNSVKYPLEEILSWTPYRYLRSSPAMALALGIWLGYPKIMLFGSELTSNTEYAYQATNYAFWIGYAHGLGIDLDLRCWQAEFEQPIYGYEGEFQVSREFYQTRKAEHEKAWNTSEWTLKKMRDDLDSAMLEHDYKKVGALSLEMENAAQASGEAAGAMGEAERYLARTDMISRQEFERVSAQAQEDYNKRLRDLYHAGGICEYIWNGWMQTGRLDVLNQLRARIKEKLEHAYNVGLQRGIFAENILYMQEYDKGLTALGGQRALGRNG